MEPAHPKYFPSLNGWRAIAAFTVIWTHVERYELSRGLPSLSGASLNTFLGGLAVSFFFVLSGFLITYLLLEEKRAKLTIDIKKFLIKRGLRILPLYFLVLIMGYLLSILVIRDTSTNIWSNGFILNAFLLSNLAFAFYMIPEILIQIWSIGTEVQFYLVWPFLIRAQAPRKLFFLFISIILAWFLMRFFLQAAHAGHSVLNTIIFRTRIDCMAIGGLFALGLFEHFPGTTFFTRLSKLIIRPGTGWLLLLFFALLVFLSLRYQASLYQLYATLFALVILRSIHRPPVILETPVMRWLGKISYGIYLLHHFCVYIVYWLFSGIRSIPENVLWVDLFRFVAACILSVVAAAASYYLFERRFQAGKI